MNFTPEMMKMAQEQMARMTPAQLADMQKMAAGMDPSVAAKMGIDPAQLRTASAAMQNMSADDMAKAAEQARARARVPRGLQGSCVAVVLTRRCACCAAQMRNMSPEDMKRQMDSANAQSGAQQQYYFKARGDT
jgi:hypothetical protein